MASKARVVGPYTLSFRCYRLVPYREAGADVFETVELCEPKKNMRALLCER